jgi:hypothetical protein
LGALASACSYQPAVIAGSKVLHGYASFAVFKLELTNRQHINLKKKKSYCYNEIQVSQIIFLMEL